MEKREQLLASAKALLSKVEAENRVFTPDEQTEYDKHLSDIKALDAQAKAADALADLEAPPPRRQLRQAQPEAVTQPDATAPAPVKVPAGVRRHKALKAFKSDQDAYSFGQFMLATVYGNRRAQQWCGEHGIDMLAQSEGSNAAGGYLVPEQFEQSIIDLRETYGVFRRSARIWPMSSDTLIVPRRASGLTAYYVGEADQITESTKGWDAVKLVAKKLAALARYSTEVGEDAVINMGDDLASEMAYAFAYQEDLAGFLGDGTSTYGGITGVKNRIAAGSTVTAATGHTAFSSLTLSDFHSVVGTLPLYARAGAKWFLSAAGFSAGPERLAYAGGGNTVQTIGGGNGMSFLGYPVELVQVMNSTLSAQTSATCVALFGRLDLAAQIGSRRGVTVAMSDQRYFEYDQIGVRATERFDIAVSEIGTASAAGPLVMLNLPGS